MQILIAYFLLKLSQAVTGTVKARNLEVVGTIFTMEVQINLHFRLFGLIKRVPTTMIQFAKAVLNEIDYSKKVYFMYLRILFHMINDPVSKIGKIAIVYL